MKKLTLFLSIALLFTTFSYAQDLDWAKKAGGTNNIDAVAPVFFTASFTVSNTGLSKCF